MIRARLLWTLSAKVKPNTMRKNECMNAETIHHYPPELMSLMVETIPLLCRGKKDVLTFFKGAGVSATVTAEFTRKVATAPDTVNKYEIVREVLISLNDGGDRTLGERREVLKRVVEFEDFSTCWANDQLKAKGLVSEIRRVVDVKDSFKRMRLEHEAERKQRLEVEKRRTAVENERKVKLDQVKKELYALFGPLDPQKRGKALEEVLNKLFQHAGILVREAFTRIGSNGEGIVEQIDGIIELDGDIYLVEMKWWEKPLGIGEVSQHLVRVFSRHGARGVLISYSGYTEPAVATCKDSLAKVLVVLCGLEELVRLLDCGGDLAGFLREKIRAAVVDKSPYYRIHP